MNGRSHTRKKSHANPTDNGVSINNEIVRMCSLVKPNQYQCINTKECDKYSEYEIRPTAASAGIRRGVGAELARQRCSAATA